MDKNKLILSIAIILASIIFGSFFYAGQTKKQQLTLSNFSEEAEIIIDLDEFKENYVERFLDSNE